MGKKKHWGQEKGGKGVISEKGPGPGEANGQHKLGRPRV